MRKMKILFLLVTLVISFDTFSAIKTKIKRSSSKGKKAVVLSSSEYASHLKNCAETLSKDPKFMETMKGQNLDDALSKVMQGRVDLAFSKTALAYLELMKRAGNEITVDPEGKIVSDTTARKVGGLSEQDKKLADSLFKMVEPTEEISPEEDPTPLLEKLQTFSRSAYGRNKQFVHRVLDENDVAIMKRLLPEVQGSSEEGKKIINELKEFASYKGGRKNIAAINEMIKKVKSFNNAKRSLINKARSELKKAFNSFVPETPEGKTCKTMIGKLLTAHSKETQFDKAIKNNDDLKSCELLSFLNSVYPAGKLSGFEKMNQAALHFMQNRGSGKVDPQTMLQRGKLVCEKKVNPDGSYKVFLTIEAKRDVFKDWLIERDASKKLNIPPEAFTQKEINKKCGKNKACRKKLQDQNSSVNISIPVENTFQKGEHAKPIYIYSPLNKEGKREFEKVDIDVACQMKYPKEEPKPTIPPEIQTPAPVAPLEVAADCSYEKSKEGISLKDFKIPLPSKTASYTVSIGAKTVDLQNDKGFLMIPDSMKKEKVQNLSDIKILLGAKEPYDLSKCKELQAPKAANEFEADSCQFEVEDNGMIILKALDFKNKDLEGSKIKIGKDSVELKANGENFSLPEGGIKLKAKDLLESKIEIISKDGKPLPVNLKDCSEASKEALKNLQDEKKKEREAKEKEEKEKKKKEMIAKACEGNENGEEINRDGKIFIYCPNGVSQSEREMILEYCKGASGEYDKKTDRIYCHPFNVAPQMPPQAPMLPPSMINDVMGINMKGFY